MAFDSELKKNVQDELNWTPNVNGAHIGVTTHDGVVTLNGHVASYAEKHDAEVAVRRVKGAKAIANDIEIKFVGSTKHSDEDIAKAAINSLAWDSSVPKDAVKVTVSNGWVTLTGEVEWYYQKEAAEHVVHRLLGVIGVSNQTTVTPKVDATTIANDISFALNRSWFDPRTIHVSATGGKVKLTGTVDSWSDWQEASNVAWAASRCHVGRE